MCDVLDFSSKKKSLYLKWSESRSVVSDSLPPPWNSLGQNAGLGSLSLLQGIFPTQGSNPGLPHRRQILYCLSHQGSLCYIAGTPISLWADSSAETLQARKEWNDIFKVLKGKICPTKNTLYSKIIIQNWRRWGFSRQANIKEVHH